MWWGRRAVDDATGLRSMCKWRHRAQHDIPLLAGDRRAHGHSNVESHLPQQRMALAMRDIMSHARTAKYRQHRCSHQDRSNFLQGLENIIQFASETVKTPKSQEAAVSPHKGASSVGPAISSRLPGLMNIGSSEADSLNATRQHHGPLKNAQEPRSCKGKKPHRPSAWVSARFQTRPRACRTAMR